MDERCTKFAGADLEFILREACTRAIMDRRDTLTQPDFEVALKKVHMIKVKS